MKKHKPVKHAHRKAIIAQKKAKSKFKCKENYTRGIKLTYN